MRFIPGLAVVCFLVVSAFAQEDPIWMEGGHSWDVNELKVSKDGSLLVSACADGTVKLWNMASGRLIRTLIGHTNIIRERWRSPKWTRVRS